MTLTLVLYEEQGVILSDNLELWLIVCFPAILILFYSGEQKIIVKYEYKILKRFFPKSQVTKQFEKMLSKDDRKI